jgi:hypothetical protein
MWAFWCIRPSDMNPHASPKAKSRSATFTMPCSALRRAPPVRHESLSWWDVLGLVEDETPGQSVTRGHDLQALLP